MKPIRLLLTVSSALLLTSCLEVRTAGAQTIVSNGSIVPPNRFTPTRVASLSEYLISRLKATTDDQKSYIRELVKLVDQGKLERRTLIALERFARRRSPYFPLPYFERALRVEAAKRGVAVPTIKEIIARNGEATAQAIQDSRVR